MNAKTELALLTLYAERPVHAGGSGSSDLADLAIQREAPSELPHIQSSAIKNALRRVVEDQGKKDLATALFGAPPPATSAGKVLCTDARLLYFPVPSLFGVFGYATCPFVLNRLRRDLGWISPGAVEIAAPPALHADPQSAEPKGWWASTCGLRAGDRVFLHDTAFAPVTNPAYDVAAMAAKVAEWFLPESADPYWEGKAKNDVVVVSDNYLGHFSRAATSLETHVAVGLHGNVTAGPWDQESLPAETLLYVLVGAPGDEKYHENGKPEGDAGGDTKTGLDWLAELLPEGIQLGGDLTLGKGWLRLKLVRKAEPAPVPEPGADKEPGEPQKGEGS